MNTKALLISVALMALSSVSMAASPVATLKVENGSVLVNQGKQFVSAQPGQLLVDGNRVMVMEGGTAKVQYANGCVVDLQSGSLLVVSDENSCATDNIATLSSNTAQVVGVDDDDDDNGAVLWWTAGAAAVAGIIIWGGAEDDNTISP